MKSSSIHSISYYYLNEESKLVLIFKSDLNKAYYYSGVTPSIFANFIQAKSKGRYFHDHINKKYTYKIKSVDSNLK